MEYKKIIQNAKNDRMNEAIEAAAELLLKGDVEDIKMTDIADKCGIGVASLYRYFGTKGDIVARAGAVLWGRIKALFDGVFESPYFTEKSGYDRLYELMKVFKVLYISHQDFLRFVDSFDRFAVNEKISPEAMHEYESSILDFYPLFENAYRDGVKDGTAKDDIDFGLMYLTVTHSLMLMSEKFSRGKVFDSDTGGEQELGFMVDMALYYIRK